MQLIEVNENKSNKKEFLLLPVRLYASDSNWIRPLDNDIEEVFDSKKNKFFKNGVCERWILKNTENETIGRIAAFINFDTSDKEQQPTGGIGFFECIDNEKAAFILFDQAKLWLEKQGMEAMDGPINFGERESWWGLMIKGWHNEPSYKMPWTKKYYIQFFEQYGFKDYYQQYVYNSPIKGASVDKSVEEKADRIFNSNSFEFRHIEKRKANKYAEDFKTVFNAAWANFPGMREMSSEQAQNLMKQIKPIMDEKLIWFAYSNNVPAAFFIVIPDINQIVKHLNGKFDIWSKIKFLLLKMKGTITRTKGIIFGVVPDHQGKGLESAIALQFRKAARDEPFYQYETMDMNWIGDFNPKMLRFTSKITQEIDKTYVTYRYLFDQTKTFERCPRVG